MKITACNLKIQFFDNLWVMFFWNHPIVTASKNCWINLKKWSSREGFPCRISRWCRWGIIPLASGEAVAGSITPLVQVGGQKSMSWQKVWIELRSDEDQECKNLESDFIWFLFPFWTVGHLDLSKAFKDRVSLKTCQLLIQSHSTGQHTP